MLWFFFNYEAPEKPKSSMGSLQFAFLFHFELSSHLTFKIYIYSDTVLLLLSSTFIYFSFFSKL